MNWIHKLFNPHCQHCADELLINKECASCEILKNQVNDLRQERDKLLDQLLNKDKPVVNEPTDEKPMVLRTSKFVSSAVRRQMLEAEDREKAKINKMNETKPEIAQLEKELGVDEIISNLEEKENVH